MSRFWLGLIAVLNQIRYVYNVNRASKKKLRMKKFNFFYLRYNLTSTKTHKKLNTGHIRDQLDKIYIIL